MAEKEKVPKEDNLSSSTKRAGKFHFPVKSFVEYFLVFLLLLAMLTVFYYPALSQINRNVISGGDAYYWVWREWMAENYSDSLLRSRVNPIQYLYYGILTTNARPECGNALDIILLSIPLRKLFGFPASWNLKILIILLFNGMAGYFVMKRWTKNVPIAFVAASFFMMNPAVFYIINKARLRDAIFGFFVLFIYFLFQVLDKPDVKNSIKASLFLGLTSVFYWFYGLFGILIALPLIIGKAVILIKEKDKVQLKKFFIGLVTGLGIFALITLPFGIYYFLGIEDVPMLNDVTLGVPFPTFEEAFQNPPPFESAGGYPMRTVPIILGDSLYLTWFPFSIPFVVLGIAAFFKKPRMAAYFLAVILFFYAYAFGPWLRIDERVMPESYMMRGGQPVKMLYSYMFEYVPVSGRLHHPIESLMVVSAAMMILGGFGLLFLKELMEKKSKVLKWIFLVLPLLCLVFIIRDPYFYKEPWHVKLGRDVRVVTVPDYYKELGKLKRTGLVQLPLRQLLDIRVFYKTFHRQKMTVFEVWNMGALEYSPLKTDQFVWSNEREFYLRDNPTLKSMEAFARGEVSEIDQSGVKELLDKGYKYILLHGLDCSLQPSPGGELYPEFAGALENAFGKHKTLFHEPADPLMPIPPSHFERPDAQFEVRVYELK